MTSAHNRLAAANILSPALARYRDPMSDTETTPRAVVRTADQHSEFRSGGTTIRILLGAEHGAASSICEFRAAPGFAGPPIPHHHTREEAVFLVVDGAIAVVFGDDEQRLGPGDLAHLPPGVDFTWRNASESEPAHFLCSYAPAGFERIFADITAALAGREPSADVLREIIPPLWRRYGIEPAGEGT
jgi:mannose-6-phosphate isomerase-like protein (cupin superfamily)